MHTTNLAYKGLLKHRKGQTFVYSQTLVRLLDRRAGPCSRKSCVLPKLDQELKKQTTVAIQGKEESIDKPEVQVSRNFQYW